MGRPKKNKVQGTYRLNRETPERLAKLALALGFTYNGRPSVGKLLDVIGMLAEKIVDMDIDE
jgi:hypothetical protein